MIDVRLVTTVLNVEDVYRLTLSPDCGAVSMFVGITRDNFNGRKVTKLFYEAYDSMALKIMNNICLEMTKKWPEVKHIIMHHRLGEVKISEASIIIAVSSPHRKDSLESVQFAIDKLKAIVPIFKKEEYDNYTSEWKENKECEWSNSNKAKT